MAGEIDTLLPCPFCGGEATVYVQDFTDDKADFGNASAYCPPCGTEQPWWPTKAEAIAAWNTRAALAQSKGEPVAQRVEELPMVAFADRLPVRDELMGEQTILTYSENVGVFSLEFFESGWEFPDRWLGASHWLDITGMWPGVTAQITEWRAPPQDPAAVERAAEPDLLAEFAKHLGWELSFEGWEDAVWQVHNVTGGRNDREWTLIGEGETPKDAIRAAIEGGAHDI